MITHLITIQSPVFKLLLKQWATNIRWIVKLPCPENMSLTFFSNCIKPSYCIILKGKKFIHRAKVLRQNTLNVKEIIF